VTTYFSIRIAKPAGDGWVRLPAERPKRSGLAAALRGKDKDLAEWAPAAAGELLGPQADPKLLDTYTGLLTDLATGARERDVKLAYAWIPGSAGVAVARIDVSMIRTSRQYPVLTLDTLEEQFGARDASTTELEVSRVELPVGPAVRLRRAWRGGDSPSDTAVSVTYACRPPEIKNAIVYTMYWSLADDDPQLTEIADNLAATLRIAT
jgi:hypothetical protein